MVELRPMVGLISALGGNQSPIAWERLRSQAVVEMGLNLRPISTETPLKMRGVFGACVGPKPCNYSLDMVQFNYKPPDFTR